MGFFSSPKSAPRSSTKVWKTKEDCLKGMVKESLLAISNSELAAVITVFDESHKRLIEFLNSTGVTHQEITIFSGKDAIEQKNSLMVINTSSASIGNSLSSEKKVALLFMGHYPYAVKENKLVEDLYSRFPNSKISFCLSLEDPLFESLGANKLKPLMESLSMKDDECLEHPMIDKAIANALEKINKSLDIEHNASSEKEWFNRNGSGLKL
jgi:preprotein translocase subunit SecA